MLLQNSLTPVCAVGRFAAASAAHSWLASAGAAEILPLLEGSNDAVNACNTPGRRIAAPVTPKALPLRPPSTRLSSQRPGKIGQPEPVAVARRTSQVSAAAKDSSTPSR